MFGEGTMDGLEQSLENTVMKCLGILRNCHIVVVTFGMFIKQLHVAWDRVVYRCLI